MSLKQASLLRTAALAAALAEQEHYACAGYQMTFNLSH